MTSAPRAGRIVSDRLPRIWDRVGGGGGVDRSGRGAASRKKRVPWLEPLANSSATDRFVDDDEYGGSRAPGPDRTPNRIVVRLVDAQADGGAVAAPPPPPGVPKLSENRSEGYARPYIVGPWVTFSQTVWHQRGRPEQVKKAKRPLSKGAKVRQPGEGATALGEGGRGDMIRHSQLKPPPPHTSRAKVVRYLKKKYRSVMLFSAPHLRGRISRVGERAGDLRLADRDEAKLGLRGRSLRPPPQRYILKTTGG